MSQEIIDGRKIASEVMGCLKKLQKPKKFLAVVLIGENPTSISFIKQKEKVAHELGVDFRVYHYSENSTQDNLRKEVGKIAAHKTCGGIIVQLPLPVHINTQYVLNAIPQEKDIDVLSERALGTFYVGRNTISPPAVSVLEKILNHLKLDMYNTSLAVVGLGFLVGKPIAVWLTGKTKEIYLLDKGSDFQILKNIDCVISGVGKAGIIKPEMLKESALVIDFGYDFVDKKIYGDFDERSFKTQNLKFKIHYTPTPGGTGPVLVAQLSNKVQ